MILAAGLGTRMLPHTRRMPKPIFPLLNKTLLDSALDLVRPLSPQVVVVNAHHLAKMVAGHLEDHDCGMRVEVSIEEKIMGTAGGIKAAQKWLEGDDIAVVNSDVITEVDWEGMRAFHTQRGALATLMLRQAPEAASYGALHVDDQGKITKFLDSVGPSHDPTAIPMMFTGVSILSPAMLERIPAGRPVDISTEIYRPMTEKGEALYGFVSTGRWTDAGTTANYHKAVMDELDKTPALTLTGGKDLKYVWIRPPVYIERGAHIRAGCILGPRVAIHSGSTLGACVYMRNCVVLPGRGVRSGACLEGEVI